MSEDGLIDPGNAAHADRGVPAREGAGGDFLLQDPFVQLAHYSTDLIALCDNDGKLLYLNPAGRSLIGVDGSDIFPLRLADYVVPHQQHLIDDEVVPAARAHGVWQGPMQLVHKRSGRIIDVTRSTFSLRDSAGNPNGFASVMRDVTHEQAAQDRLRREAETFYGLIANDPFGVYVVDADFTLRQVSQGAQKVFENVRPLIGRDFAEVLRAIWPEPFATEAIGHFRHTLETGTGYVSPSTIEQRVDIGVREAYDWRLDRIRLPDGRHGVVCYFYDLTEREAWASALAERESRLRSLSEELDVRVRERTSALTAATERLVAEIERREEVQAALLQSQKMEALGQLTSGVAHDFNNLIGAMLGAFTLIEGRTADPRILRIAKLGQDAANRGATLVRQLMSFARERPLSPQPIELPALLGEAEALIAHAIRAGIELRIAPVAELWQVHADATQLQSALLNLAVNARDAMPDGGTITIAAENRPATGAGYPPEMNGIDAVAITIADTGTGMAPEVLQRVMEPFFTTKGVGKGTGLGLAMVHGFINQSGGAIRIESRPGEGTRFTLFLPRAAALPQAAATVPEPLEEAPRTLPFRSILVVDDDASLREVVAESLRDRGYVAHMAGGAARALALIDEVPIDAVVTDVNMPDVDGIALARRIRAARPEMPCLFITARKDLHQLDDEVVLEKPFTPAALGDAVARLLHAQDRRFARQARFDRLAARLRSDCTRALFAQWRAAIAVGNVPHWSSFDIAVCAEPHRVVVAEVDLGKVPIEFNLAVVGDTLRQSADGSIIPLEIATAGNDSLAAREAAYRRCALSGRPSFEYARSDLGEGQVETFERLLLPWSTDGRTVDRIVGAVVIANETAGETGDDA